jgi:hypothetical protein
MRQARLRLPGRPTWPSGGAALAGPRKIRTGFRVRRHGGRLPSPRLPAPPSVLWFMMRRGSLQGLKELRGHQDLHIRTREPGAPARRDRQGRAANGGGNR